jgi:succinate dehydrogenase/fumarate reductase-like Fe-S protein
MNTSITANIFRYDPDTDEKPYFKEYKIITDHKTSVLVLLDHIHREMDQTLSFRNYCCGLQMCRSCLMKINHKKSFACLTLITPGEEVVIEPATYPDDHIKDLVVRIKE